MSFCNSNSIHKLIADCCTFLRLIVFGVIALSIFLIEPLQAAGEHDSATTEAVALAAKPSTVVLAPTSDYCTNIAKPAADARYALQLKTLEELQNKIDEKITQLEHLNQQKIAFELKQTEKTKTAQKAIVDIYSKMKPDVAAGQLELLDPETAVSILSQLNVRTAGTILNEMKSPVAAVLTAAMADAAKVAQP
jgi:flagellar motility protein MotE (MotC chaperone)